MNSPREILPEEFLRLMHAQLNHGSSPVKAMRSVIQKWNVSLDDIRWNIVSLVQYEIQTTTGKIGGFSKTRQKDFAVFFGLDFMQQKVESCGLKPVYVPNELTALLHPYNHSKANIVCSQKSAVKSSLVNCPSGTFNFNVLLGHLDIFPFWSLFGGS